jgi:hypothetical protein
MSRPEKALLNTSLLKLDTRACIILVVVVVGSDYNSLLLFGINKLKFAPPRIAIGRSNQFLYYLWYCRGQLIELGVFEYGISDRGCGGHSNDHYIARQVGGFPPFCISLSFYFDTVYLRLFALFSPTSIKSTIQHEILHYYCCLGFPRTRRYVLDHQHAVRFIHLAECRTFRG